MSTDELRSVVGVFDLRERAERTAAQLMGEGYAADRVRVVAPTDPGARDSLAAAGAGAYYAGESEAGRWLVVVLCHPPALAGVLCAFGRNGGSVRVPPEVRDGTA